MRILMDRRGSLGVGRLFLLDEIEGLIRGLVVLLYGIKVKAQDYNCFHQCDAPTTTSLPESITQHGTMASQMKYCVEMDNASFSRDNAKPNKCANLEKVYPIVELLTIP
jgi:hypothetical protein